MSPAGTFKPSEKLQTKFNLWVILIFVLFIFPFIFLGFIPDLGWTYVWIFLVSNALWMAPTFLLIPAYYRSIEYELGDEEVVVRKGIITKSVKTVPYRAVTNVEVTRGPLDRRLGIASIAVHTAGYSSQSGPEVRLSGLEDYEGVHADIFSALRRYRARTGPTGGVEEAPPPQEGIPKLLGEILKELRALRQSLGRQD